MMKATRPFSTRALVPVIVIAAVVALIFLLGKSPNARAETQAAPAGQGAQNGAQEPGPKLIDPATFHFPVQLSVQQWKKRLTPAQFDILRDKGTDPPFHNEYWNNHNDGTYYSAATGQPLFSSADKFESGTGWPSFTKPISPDSVVLAKDDSLGMERIEVMDSLSGSHLGHLFDDGPPPTGLRYCMDSTSMIFVPAGGTPPKLITADLASAAK